MRDPSRLGVLVQWRQRGQQAAVRSLEAERQREAQARAALEAVQGRLVQAKSAAGDSRLWAQDEEGRAVLRGQVMAARAEVRAREAQTVRQQQLVLAARQKTETMRVLQERALQEVAQERRRREEKEADELGRQYASGRRGPWNP